MRLFYSFITVFACISMGLSAHAAGPIVTAKGNKEHPQQLEVTADQSLEYYQEKHLYVARGNAKAKRGELTVTADMLTAHERDKGKNSAPKQPKSDSGDIDLMNADGHVVITDPRQRITGEHAVYDLDKHQMIVTGGDLRYETAKEVVTAKDSLEYYEDTKLAVARGHAVADQPTRHVEGDVLTAEFRDAPNGQTQLSKMTSQGHVVVITKGGNSGGRNKGGDVSHGDRAVYDAASNMAVLSGNVKITRGDGTELSGDVGEVDFNKNENRLMNQGSGRVRALLPAKTTDKPGKAP